MYSGKNPNPNAFWFYDTRDNIFHDLEFDVGSLIVDDLYTTTKIQIVPKISTEINVHNIINLYHNLNRETGCFGNTAIASFLKNRKGPDIREFISKKIEQSSDVYSLNNNLANIFTDDFKMKMKNFLYGLGIEMNDIHVLSLGLAESTEANETRGNVNETALFCNKVRMISYNLGLEPRAAMQYILAQDALKQQYIGNPLQMELAHKIANGTIDLF